MPNVRPQARGIERRRRLVEAATTLFAQGGTRGTGIAAVAERAGVTNATLLHHFGSKEALLLAVLEARDEREAEPWRRIVGAGGLGTIRGLADIATSWTEDPEVARLHAILLAESLDPTSPMHDYFVRRQSALRRDLRRAIEVGQASGEIRSEADARSTATAIASFLDGAVLQWQLDPQRVPLQRVFAAYLGELERSLAA